MTWLPPLFALALLTVIVLKLGEHRSEPGEFDDVEREQRKLAALARARKDQTS